MEFLRAAEITPNLTFLYIQIGANYRRLLDAERSLEYFDRAAKINEQLGHPGSGTLPGHRTNLYAER